MRVLVTGHDGYIGHVLVPLLQERGHEVTGLDSLLFADCGFGPSPLRLPAIARDVRAVRPHELQGFDAVLHLAGLSNDPLGDFSPELTYDINHAASVRLARLAKEAGVGRFVFSSSCSNYGAAGDAPLDGDLVVNNLVGYAVTTGAVLIKSDGKPWRPLVHIEDIARAFVAVLEAPRDLVHNEAFNVGRSEENYRVREVAELVAAAVPGARVTFAADASPDARNYRVSCDKIRARLPGYQPQWTLGRGIAQIRDAYRAYGLTEDGFLSSRFVRLKHVRTMIEAGRLDGALRWKVAA